MDINKRLAHQIEFILEVDKIKQVFRQSLLSDYSRTENDAEHSWHLALMAIVLAEHANEPGLDLLRVLKMVIIHDLVEIDAGDTYIYDLEGNKTKFEKEKIAADRIFKLLPADQAQDFRQLWEEFELKKSPEAKFAVVLDRLEPVLLNYKTEGHTWNKFGIKSAQVKAKNEHVKEGSVVIWDLINQILDDCIVKGYLIK